MEQPFPHSEWYDQSLPAPPVENPPKKRRSGLKAATIAVCVLVLIVASVYAFSDRPGFVSGGTEQASPAGRSGSAADDFRRFFEENYRSPEKTYSGSKLERMQGDPGVAVQIVPAAGKAEKSLQQLYLSSVDSIVGIKARASEDRGYFWGTGIILTADGYIVTNQHIVDGAVSAAAILPDGSEREALLVGEDTQTDIAVLKIRADGLAPAEFGDSLALSVGDRVAAIGNPLGDELTGTMTDGIISAINRDISVNGRRMTLLQTNAALNEGSSGGPLLNMYGQVIGITNMKMVNYYSGVSIEGIGFAIPSATVKSVADQLITRGEVRGRPGLGVTLGAVSAATAGQYHVPEGLYVFSVADGSDSKAKGIREGDIVTHVNGQEVRTTDDVLRIRDALSVGDTMVLTVWRDGKTFDLPITLQDQNEIY